MRCEPQHYNKGDVLAFHQDVINHRVKAGDHYTVAAIAEDGRLKVENDGGETRSIKPRGNIRYAYDVYEPHPISLQEGEQLRFTRNDTERDIANCDTAEIIKIAASKIHLTDNIEQLAETLEANTGERMTAMEAVGETVREVEAELEQDPSISHDEVNLDAHDAALNEASLEEGHEMEIALDLDEMAIEDKEIELEKENELELEQELDLDMGMEL
jgi:hypothetical protein